MTHGFFIAQMLFSHNFDHTYLAIPKVKSDDFFTKTKERTSSQFFIHLGLSAHSNGNQNPRLRYQVIHMKQIRRLLRQSLLD
jgi:hypothetical protein